MRLNRQRGLSILGVTVAVFIVAAGLVAALALLNMTLRVAQANQQKIIAYFLVQEGLEVVRNMRDTNWLQEEAWNTGLSEEYKKGTVNYNSNVDYIYKTAFFEKFSPSWSIDDCIFNNPNPETSPCRLYLSEWLDPSGGEFYMGDIQAFSRYFHILSGSDPPDGSAPTSFYRMITVQKVVPVADKERISVLSQVKWIDNNNAWHLMQAEEILWNWY